MIKKLVIVIVLLAGIFYLGSFLRKTGMVSQEISCVDTDGGAKYYIKGNTTGMFSIKSKYASFTDYCFNHTVNSTFCKGYGCSVQEFYCGYKNLMYTTISLCSKGCYDGACVTSKQSIEELKKKDEEKKKEEAKKLLAENKTLSPALLPEEPRQTKVSIFNRIFNFFKKVFS